MAKLLAKAERYKGLWISSRLTGASHYWGFVKICDEGDNESVYYGMHSLIQATGSIITEYEETALVTPVVIIPKESCETKIQVSTGDLEISPVT